MDRIIVDADLLQKLGNITKPLELCDASGKVLGQLFPEVDLSEYEPWIPPDLTEAELRRLEQSDQKRYTTKEVLEHLERL